MCGDLHASRQSGSLELLNAPLWLSSLMKRGTVMTPFWAPIGTTGHSHQLYKA